MKRILGGADADAVASRSSLADPTALDWFEDYAASGDAEGARPARLQLEGTAEPT